MEIGHETISTVIFPYSADLRTAVSYWQKYVHKVPINSIQRLRPTRKSLTKLPDRAQHDLNIVDWTVKIKPNQNFHTSELVMRATFTSQHKFGLRHAYTKISVLAAWHEKISASEIE